MYQSHGMGMRFRSVFNPDKGKPLGFNQPASKKALYLFEKESPKKKTYTPENERMSPKKGLFQKGIMGNIYIFPHHLLWGDVG